MFCYDVVWLDEHDGKHITRLLFDSSLDNIRDGSNEELECLKRCFFSSIREDTVQSILRISKGVASNGKTEFNIVSYHIATISDEREAEANFIMFGAPNVHDKEEEIIPFSTKVEHVIFP